MPLARPYAVLRQVGTDVTGLTGEAQCAVASEVSRGLDMSSATAGLPSGRGRAGWRFWVWWLLAHVAGGALLVAAAVVTLFGVIFAYGFSALCPERTPCRDPAFTWDVVSRAAVIWAVGCLMVAGMQWLALRRLVPWAAQWGLATLAAWGLVGPVVGFGVFSAVAPAPDFPDMSDESIAFAFTGFLVALGVVLGLIQWLVLRQRVSGAGQWMLANAVGWVLDVSPSLAFLAMLFWIAEVAALVAVLVALLVGPLLGAAITGTSMLRLLRQPAPEALARGSTTEG